MIYCLVIWNRMEALGTDFKTYPEPLRTKAHQNFDKYLNQCGVERRFDDVTGQMVIPLKEISKINGITEEECVEHLCKEGMEPLGADPAKCHPLH
ncbi:hypothetical protein GCM10011332_32740 [Terasakiella brassicae]|uniref:Uncharacterized protein n=1 Tax=Terasakiella brassicae TaxID=1634917 RepID=A0A917C9H8_9PROT|nr:hypothetical protein [Terasakiella brassicae]GGF76234.1 hypothetical protein GCM10011332_32740 [Terasakiella brassicae]